MPMNKRKILTRTMLALAMIGVFLIAIPFANSLWPNPKQENESWGACDISDIAPGEIRRCGSSFVYHRTMSDKSSINNFTHLLDDPTSTQSEQPDSLRTEFRSENEDYFIFKPWAPNRHCVVELMEPLKNAPWNPPEQKALETLPYFTEGCEGRTWDTSGRLYRRIGYPVERNLIVPKVRWVSKYKVLIYGS